MRNTEKKLLTNVKKNGIKIKKSDKENNSQKSYISIVQFERTKNYFAFWVHQYYFGQLCILPKNN